MQTLLHAKLWLVIASQSPGLGNEVWGCLDTEKNRYARDTSPSELT